MDMLMMRLLDAVCFAVCIVGAAGLMILAAETGTATTMRWQLILLALCVAGIGSTFVDSRREQ